MLTALTRSIGLAIAPDVTSIVGRLHYIITLFSAGFVMTIGQKEVLAAFVARIRDGQLFLF
jgi:hypothetical protein